MYTPLPIPNMHDYKLSSPTVVLPVVASCRFASGASSSELKVFKVVTDVVMVFLRNEQDYKLKKNETYVSNP